MNALVRSVLASRHSITAYWVTTALLVSELLLGGVWDVLQVPQVVGVIQHLGYPSYFLIILGLWKLVGGIVLVAPRFPRLKEWAYAGAVFDLTGAVASHLAARSDLSALIYPSAMTAVALASWAFRPPSRRLGSL